MNHDPFSRCHPAVNFIFFLGAIGFGVVIQHPAYLAAGCASAAVYYLQLRGIKGLKTICGMLPLLVLIAGINPLFNTRGSTVLFLVASRPYTLEALHHGVAVAAIFTIMMLWFGCWDRVLTSDKFTSLFGNWIPSLSLLLVMVLRMIPGFMGKARQLTGARRSIGKGPGRQSPLREKITHGMTILSALADWTLEGSIVTADSMRARGYGTARRTCFQIYHWTARDLVIVSLSLVLAAGVILAGGTGASYTPAERFDSLSWGFAAYCLYLSIPIVLHWKEVILWRIFRSKI